MRQCRMANVSRTKISLYEENLRSYIEIFWLDTIHERRYLSSNTQVAGNIQQDPSSQHIADL